MTADQPRVRDATAADLPAMSHMAAELVRYHHAVDPQRFFLARGVEEGYRGWFTRELEQRGVVLLVAELPTEPEPIGYCYGRLEGRDWNLLLDRHVALHDVFVREHARRAGVAERLVRTFLDRASALGAPRIVLSTASANASAQALFAKLGFRATMIEMTRECAPGHGSE
ncbi:MAG: GNAT family N-acetyltransferase [Myxococcota bacterium]|nr:GNAT family N-acetyltransferase [Myxococcota bacterium]